MDNTSTEKTTSGYNPPPYSLLYGDEIRKNDEEERKHRETAYRIQETLRTFGINVTITDIQSGPVFTRYELRPDYNVKVSRIVNLLDDIQLRIAAKEIRIQAPIPGKSAIGIDVRNDSEKILHLRELLESSEFLHFSGRLPVAVGKDIGGKTIVYDIAEMPHLLISGTTGSGVSVFIHTIILSLLYRSTPNEIKFLLIDPKSVESNPYKHLPHLLVPVITDARKALAALNWAVAEMEKRYRLFAAAGVRDLDGYNSHVSYNNDSFQMHQEGLLPRIVIIIDEFAELMILSKNEVENVICRLAQLERASGIHLIISTQRPSVDVITGLIKVNIPSRIAFAVTSQVDSRTILEATGAEKLDGKGDMLFYPQDYRNPVYVQGAFVSYNEVLAVTQYIKSHNPGSGHDKPVSEQSTGDKKQVATLLESLSDIIEEHGRDEHFEAAGRYIIEKNRASIGHLQRVFKFGFNRAARIMDQLAEAGVVSEESSTRARKVLMTMQEFERYLEENQ